MAKRKPTSRSRAPRAPDSAPPPPSTWLPQAPPLREGPDPYSADVATDDAVTSSPIAIATPGARTLHLVALAAAALGLIALPAPAGHDYAPLYDAGRVLALAGALLALPRLITSLRARPTTSATTAPRFFAHATLWSLVLLVLGLGGLLARHTWSFRVFADVHPADFGAPSELAFVAIAVGLRRARHTQDRFAFGALALGLAWGVVALLVPEPGVATVHSALSAAFANPVDGLAGVSAIALLLALLAALAVLARTFLRLPLTRIQPLARYVPPALLAFLILSGLASDTPLHALLIGVVLTAIALGAEHVLADHAARSASAPSTTRPLLIATFVVIVGLWLLLKSQALIASNTDENIYFYMAKLLSTGKLPYKDYFFAHPALHVMLPGIAFSVFGFSLSFAKLFPMFATLIGGCAVWGIARRSFSPLAAPLAMVLYLFASEVLKASSNMTGVNMTAMWLLLGTWQALKGHPLRAGMLLGAAVSTGFYAMAPALAVVALGFFWHDDSDARAPKQREGLMNGLRLLVGFALVAGAINLAFYAIGGKTYLEGVYAYHQQKVFEDPDMVEVFGGAVGFPGSLLHNLGVMMRGGDFTKEVFYHAHLWLAGLAAPLVALASWVSPPAAQARGKPWRVLFPTTFFRTGADGRALVLWLVTLSLLVEFAMFRELYSFYFVLIYPFLALLGAYAIWRALTLLTPPTPSTSSTSFTPTRALVAAGLGLAAFVGLALHGAVSDSVQVIFDDEQEVIGSRNDYAWTEPPVLASLGGITKLLFWEGSRIKGAIEPGYRHYLWTKKRGFTVLDEVAEYIHAHSTPSETIAGTSTLAPLVALLADRRIAADEIDTNNKRFQTKILPEDQYWNEICQDNVRFLVASPRSYFTREKLDSLPIVKRAFASDRVFDDPTLQYNAPFQITLYRRIDGAVCAWTR